MSHRQRIDSKTEFSSFWPSSDKRLKLETKILKNVDFVNARYNLSLMRYGESQPLS